MTTGRPLRGTVDRIVDGRATILVEGEVDFDEAALPPGTGEGDVVRFDISAGFVVVDVDVEETERRRTELEARMDRLRSERTGGRFAGGASGDGDDETGDD